MGCINDASQVGDLCDAFNPCTANVCDPVLYCVFPPANAGATCDDADGCTLDDRCGTGGTCQGRSVCDDQNPCTDDYASGTSCACSHEPTYPGTLCSDGDLCTTGETCRSGTCVPASSGLIEPNPRTNGYYRRLCHGPHSGDQLTNADAECVAEVAHAFASVSSVADLCVELEPAQPNNDSCDRADDDLMVLALNICRARVCAAQSVDSQCGGNATVAQSLAAADAILCGSRNDAGCAQAKCVTEEINTGRALELNTLTVRRELGGVRLDWLPPHLDDGTGHPSRYNVWRRPQGSATPFLKVGSTVDPTFVDLDTVSDGYQYEVTAVMN